MARHLSVAGCGPARPFFLRKLPRKSQGSGSVARYLSFPLYCPSALYLGIRTRRSQMQAFGDNLCANHITGRWP